MPKLSPKTCIMFGKLSFLKNSQCRILVIDNVPACGYQEQVSARERYKIMQILIVNGIQTNILS